MERRGRLAARRTALAEIAQRLDITIPANTLPDLIAGADTPRTGAEWLRIAGLELGQVVPDLAARYEPALLAEATEDARYAPYVARQASEVARLRGNDAIVLPPELDFAGIPGLSNEMIERLMAARPTTLGAASRIRGITPAALTAIHCFASSSVMPHVSAHGA
jgi:tRNA uridine 5-carboxymethylaminomethyl modification enzyme